MCRTCFIVFIVFIFKNLRDLKTEYFFENLNKLPFLIFSSRKFKKVLQVPSLKKSKNNFTILQGLKMFFSDKNHLKTACTKPFLKVVFCQWRSADCQLQSSSASEEGLAARKRNLKMIGFGTGVPNQSFGQHDD